MRQVVDTNIVISSIFWNGGPRRLLDVATDADIPLFVSQPLLDELTDVLSRSKFERKLSLSPLPIRELVDEYANSTILVMPLIVPRIAPDPDDDMGIGTALAAKADFIVTGDRTLLSVVQYEGVRIVSVSEALKAIAVS